MSNTPATSLKVTPPWLVWLSHFIVPVVFFFYAYQASRNFLYLSWQLIVVLVIACAPFILVLLSRYVKKLKIGDHEYESPEEISITNDTLKKLNAAAPAVRVAKPAYGDLSRGARKVLRTLWTYQRQQFPADDLKRWGFVVPPGGLDYSQFRIGATELREIGLIVENDNGMVFLNNEGMDYCKENQNAINGGGDIWGNFGAA